LEEKNLRKIYPISWVTESSHLIDFLDEWYSTSEDNLLVADFASGEYDRVPSFFSKFLPQMLEMKLDYNKRIVAYCIDLHLLRLESLLGKLKEDDLLDNVRIVHSALETMHSKAEILEASLEFIVENTETATWLDDFLIGEKQFPSECFDIGILNTDVIGYLFEYYKEYSDAEKALSSIWSLIRPEGLLIITMPCLQYKIDNISVLENIGFNFLEGIDITLVSGQKTILQKDVPLNQLSTLGHYTFMIFRKL